MLLPAYEGTPGYPLGVQNDFFPRWGGCHDPDNAGEFCCASDSLTTLVVPTGDLTTFTQNEVKVLKAAAIKVLSEPSLRIGTNWLGWVGGLGGS